MNDDPSLEFVLGALEANDLIPSFSDFPRANMRNEFFENCGQINPDEIEHYIGNGGYKVSPKRFG